MEGESIGGRVPIGGVFCDGKKIPELSGMVQMGCAKCEVRAELGEGVPVPSTKQKQPGTFCGWTGCGHKDRPLSLHQKGNVASKRQACKQ